MSALTQANINLDIEAIALKEFCLNRSVTAVVQPLPPEIREQREEFEEMLSAPTAKLFELLRAPGPKDNLKPPPVTEETLRELEEITSTEQFAERLKEIVEQVDIRATLGLDSPQETSKLYQRLREMIKMRYEAILSEITGPPTPQLEEQSVFDRGSPKLRSESALEHYKMFFSGPDVSALSPDTRKSFFEIADFLDKHEIIYLTSLKSRKLESGKPVLEATDTNGKTLAANLASLITTGDSPFLRNISQRQRIVASAVELFGEPGRMSQGDRGTCLVTAPFWDFNVGDAGELGRVVADLFIQGKAELRWPGRFLELSPEALKDNIAGSLSVVENALYIAAMNFEVKQGGRYDLGTDKRDLGLESAYTSLVESFYDQDFDILTINTKRDNAADLIEVLKNNLPGRIRAALAWGPEVTIRETWTGPVKGRLGHAITVLRCDADGFVIRNPWGGNLLRRRGEKITKKDAPTRIIVDPLNGIEKIPVTDFENALLMIEVPYSGSYASPEALNRLTREEKDFYLAWEARRHPPEVLAAAHEVLRDPGFRQSTPALQAEVISLLALHPGDAAVGRRLGADLQAYTSDGQELITSAQEEALLGKWRILHEEDVTWLSLLEQTDDRFFSYLCYQRFHKAGKQDSFIALLKSPVYKKFSEDKHKQFFMFLHLHPVPAVAPVFDKLAELSEETADRIYKKDRLGIHLDLVDSILHVVRGLESEEEVVELDHTELAVSLIRCLEDPERISPEASKRWAAWGVDLKKLALANPWEFYNLVDDLVEHGLVPESWHNYRIPPERDFSDVKGEAVNALLEAAQKVKKPLERAG